MDTLPAELLLNIFDLVAHHQPWLAACNRVSKRWHLLTKETLYHEPELRRIKALECFVQTVSDSQEGAWFSSSSSTTIKTTSTNTLDRHTPQQQSSSLLDPKLPLTGHAPIPCGALVHSVDLSMLPHRWESVHVGLIQGLVQGCPFVTTLNLTDCALLRDNAIQMIAETLGPRQLRSLVLSGCIRITDVAILSLCAHAVQLENLELSGCLRISDISVRELGVATVPNVSKGRDPIQSRTDRDDTMATIDHVRGISRSLRSLDLSHCIRITDSSIRALRAGATRLKSLNLEGCYGILLNNDDLDTNEWEDVEEEGEEEEDEDFIEASF